MNDMVKIELIAIYNETRCNLDCSYCYTKERRQSNCSLDDSMVRQIITQAKQLGARQVFLAGPGEPLISKCNLELIDFIYRSGMQPMVYTNGLFLDENTIAFLRSRRVNLTVKLHALKKDRYDKLAGAKTDFTWVERQILHRGQTFTVMIPDFIELLIQGKYTLPAWRGLLTPRTLLELRRGMTGHITRHPLLRFETVITHENQEDIVKLAMLSKQLGVPLLVETLISQVGSTADLGEVASQTLFLELASILGPSFLRNQSDSGCKYNTNPVIFEDGRVGLCLVKPTDVSWMETRSLAKSMRKVLSEFSPPLLSHHSGFRTCYGRYSSEKENDNR